MIFCTLRNFHILLHPCTNMFSFPQTYSSIQIISVGGLFQPSARSPAMASRMSPPTFSRSPVVAPRTLSFDYQRKPVESEISSEMFKSLISAVSEDELRGKENLAKKRKLQNAVRQLFNNFDKKFPGGYPPEKMWEYFFGNDQVSEKRFFSRLRNYIPQNLEISNSDMFAALLVPTARQARNIIQLRSVPDQLSKEVFSLAFRTTPFNQPEFPVPRHSQDESKVFDLEETATRIARTILAQLSDLPDFTLSGRLSIEELQVCLGRPLLPLRVIEAGVSRILKDSENKLAKDFDIRHLVLSCQSYN